MTYFDEPPYPRFQERKHSGLGIASFVIGLVAGFLDLVLCAIAGVLEASTPGWLDENSTVAGVMGVGLIAAMVANLFGLGLGIAGLLQSDRRKLFAILGVVFGCLALLWAIVLVVVAIAMQYG